MTEAMPFLQKAILLSYDPLPLQPGDLIFWSKVCTCGRWNEIHHTGIYIGDGRIVDASSSKGRVVLRSLWGENGSAWKIVLYARPHV